MKKIVLVQPNCGKYDLYILDMPLGLLYLSRLLIAAGYEVVIVDQRILREKTSEILTKLLLDSSVAPLWVGFTVMTGEPITHALALSKLIKKISSTTPVVWGGIHPTILPEVTLANPAIDYLIKGPGERAALLLSKCLQEGGDLKQIPGLSYKQDEQMVHLPRDEEVSEQELPMVPYHLVDHSKYFRVGFEKKLFSIMTSRHCPHQCTFCYNSSLMQKKPWIPDSLEYTFRHIDFILENYSPEYLSFIDDDFLVDKKRARAIFQYLIDKKLPMKIGLRGVRITDLYRLDDEFLDLMAKANTVHLNIGVESGSEKILNLIKKGSNPSMIFEVNRRLAKWPNFIPLYNFFSGIPAETIEDIRLSTQMILRLVKENPYCQISGHHQYTPYPGNLLFEEAVERGFPVPITLEGWGKLHFEDNAKNCPWIDKKRKKILDMIYFSVYFVDGKYDTYFAKNNWSLRLLKPAVSGYKSIAKLRLKYLFYHFPLELYAKDLFYWYLYDRKD
ncbi:MAG: B12-binding domain-containing radical SAM protein [Oligoflexia bacterium]|nr:B12-binding domain-containing radical SAM protein [Oligoflexia bacterium]